MIDVTFSVSVLNTFIAALTQVEAEAVPFRTQSSAQGIRKA